MGYLSCSFVGVLYFQPLLGLTRWGWLPCSLSLYVWTLRSNCAPLLDSDSKGLISAPSGIQTWDLSGMDSLLEFENTGVLKQSATMQVMIYCYFETFSGKEKTWKWHSLPAGANLSRSWENQNWKSNSRIQVFQFEGKVGSYWGQKFYFGKRGERSQER